MLVITFMGSFEFQIYTLIATNVFMLHAFSCFTKSGDIQRLGSSTNDSIR